MRNRVSILIIIFFVAVTCMGCANSKARRQDIDKKFELARDALKDPKNDYSDAFCKMTDACESVLARFETKAQHLQYWQIGIATGGAFAGLVVPALTTAAASGNTVWTALLGGVSGTANATQLSMQSSGMTPQQILLNRSKVLDQLTKAIQDYNDPAVTAAGKKAAILRALTACKLYDISIPETQLKKETSGTQAQGAKGESPTISNESSSGSKEKSSVK